MFETYPDAAGSTPFVFINMHWVMANCSRYTTEVFTARNINKYLPPTASYKPNKLQTVYNLLLG